MRFTHDQILRLIITVAALAFLITTPFSLLTKGQEKTDGQPTEVYVPDAVMKQVVNRVLKRYFKPRADKKIIFLASDGMKVSWLPKISNTEFHLLSTDEIRKFKGTVYLFTAADFADGIYSIGFAMGDGLCAYTGDYWHFRFVSGKVRLWENGRVGGDCASDSFKMGPPPRN